MEAIARGVEDSRRLVVKSTRFVAVVAITMFALDYVRTAAAALNTADAKTPFVFDVGVAQIPHPDKVDKGGEDTYYVAADRKSMGVFDGVGGWNDEGVDPRAYSLALSKGAQEAADKRGIVKPNKIMKFAWSSIDASIAGSSTACIVSITDQRVLRSSCLGDSGFVVFSPSKDGKHMTKMFRSKEQQHAFNFPFQLGHTSKDSPSNAIAHDVDINEGDVIVLGSDGLFDNMFDKEISDVLDVSLTGHQGFEVLTDAAAKLAQHASINSRSKRTTPFSLSAYEHGFMHRGGKVDDITVLVARIRAHKVDARL